MEENIRSPFLLSVLGAVSGQKWTNFLATATPPVLSPSAKKTAKIKLIHNCKLFDNEPRAPTQLLSTPISRIFAAD